MTWSRPTGHRLDWRRFACSLHALSEPAERKAVRRDVPQGLGVAGIEDVTNHFARHYAPPPRGWSTRQTAETAMSDAFIAVDRRPPHRRQTRSRFSCGVELLCAVQR